MNYLRIKLGILSPEKTKAIKDALKGTSIVFRSHRNKKGRTVYLFAPEKITKKKGTTIIS